MRPEDYHRKQSCVDYIEHTDCLKNKATEVQGAATVLSEEREISVPFLPYPFISVFMVQYETLFWLVVSELSLITLS